MVQMISHSVGYTPKNSFATSVTVSAPPVYAAGNLFVLTVMVGGTAGATPATPAGWTRLSAATSPFGVFARTATAAESAVTVTLSASAPAAAYIASYPAATVNSSRFTASAANVTSYSPTFPTGVGTGNLVLMVAGAAAQPFTRYGGSGNFGYSGYENIGLPANWVHEIDSFGPADHDVGSNPNVPAAALGSITGPAANPTLTSTNGSSFFVGFLVLTVTGLAPTPLAVTALAGGNAIPGMALTVSALGNAAVRQTGAWTWKYSGGASAAPQITITPNASGGMIFGAVTDWQPSSAYTALGSTIFDQNFISAFNGGHGTFRSAASTTAGTAVTVGASAPANTRMNIAAAEIVPNGSLLVRSTAISAGKALTDFTSTVLSRTAYFLGAEPLPGDLLVATVSVWSGYAQGTSPTVTLSDSDGYVWSPLVESRSASGAYAGVWVAQIPAPAPAPTGIASLSGSGRLAGSGTPRPARTVSLSGAATLVGPGSPRSAVAGLSADGVLAGAAALPRGTSAFFSADGVLLATGAASPPIAATPGLIERAVFTDPSWTVFWSAPGGQTTVFLAPVAAFTALQSSPGDPVDFDGSGSHEQGGTIEQWIWDFGDGSSTVSVTGPMVSHAYTRPGTYSVNLVVVDGSGKRAQATRSVQSVVDLRPVASFTADMSDLTVNVDASASSDVDGQISSYFWDFGDGATADGVTARHDYPFGGTYDITLVVTDNLGAVSMASQTVEGAFVPVADFTFTTSGLTVRVDATASYDFDPIAHYYWSWGIAGSVDSSGATATHTYPRDGTYAISLTIEDVAGHTDTVTHEVRVASVVVPEPPVMRFTTSVTNLKASFDASKTTDVDSFLVNYSWSFGDNKSGSGVTTSHTYADGGTYPVILTGTDNLGAKGTVRHNVTVGQALPPSDPGGPPSGKERTSFPYQDMNHRNVISGPPSWINNDPDESWREHRERPGLGGVDHIAPYGTPLYANCAGKVHRVPWYGTGGNTLRIYLGNTGWYDEYMHLSTYAVQDGEHVKQGQLVGHSGASASGDSYGVAPHFHLHRYNPQGDRLNAWHYFAGSGTKDSRNDKPGQIIDCLITGVPNLAFYRRLQWYAGLNGYAYPCDGFMSIPAWKGVQKGLRNYGYRGAIDGHPGAETYKALEEMAHQYGSTTPRNGKLSTADYRAISKRLNEL